MQNKVLDYRVGFGFDVHAFDDETAKTVRLGGVDIPFDKKLKGHSDADVILHALCDAILGAAGLGDIGEHFPPSDKEHKDKDSRKFVNHVIKLIEAKVNNIDITVICEKPKLSAHKKAIKEEIARLCEIDETRVNIKATTTEGLGFTGRGEGIACQACVTLITE